LCPEHGRAAGKSAPEQYKGNSSRFQRLVEAVRGHAQL
jgi:hypothetical protein